MARYIDADLFKDKVVQYANERESSIAIKLLSKVPTANVVEKKTGKWVLSKAVNAYGGHVRCCSLCDYTFSEPNEKTCEDWNYCCRCGAEMNGK